MTSIHQPPSRKLRMALIGGGGEAFIGRVHFMAATLDNRAQLVAAVLSSNAEKARAFAPEFGIDPSRAYGSYSELIRLESELSADEQIDFVSIATPNYTHFAIAKGALEAGFNVVCDKPMTNRLEDALELVRLVEQTGAVFALTHNYTGYPLVRQAREMIQQGELGQIQAVRAKYIQGWMRGLLPGIEPARGAWKSDPKKAGPSGTLGDLGTHAFNLIRYVTRLMPTEVSCQLMTCQPEQLLDDYGHAMIRFSNDALGTVTVSQVTHGTFNDLAVEIDGTKGSLMWRQEEPNQLFVRRFGQPVQIYERHPMAPFMHEDARASCRLPGGHPEGFLAAFANVYRDAFADMIARQTGQSFDSKRTNYPNVYDGVEGISFIEQCVASSRDNCAWKPLPHAWPQDG